MKNKNKNFPESTLINYVNTGAAIVAGDVVRIGNRFGLAMVAIAASTGNGLVQTEGQFRLPKTSGAIAQGAKLVWDTTNKRVGALGTVDGTFIGFASDAAASADTTVNVNLSSEPGLTYIKHTVTSGEDTANSADVDTQLGAALTGVASVQIESTANVRRAPAGAVTLLTSANLGKVRVVDAALAVNEVIHLIINT